ncbi:MAG TPA: carboxymuconolactone decarboxylase family protein [Actinomycetes bacterium]|nr:carboxymuconolactone decarboxylase family protein [Actinomycetes bacterium]
MRVIQMVHERGEQTEVRLAPAPPRALGVTARLVGAAAATVTRGEAPRVLTTLARHRRLFRWWLPFAGQLLLRTELPRADVELVVLRTACNCLSWYEWAQHASLARRAGLPRAAIDAVPCWAHPTRLGIWTARQRLLLLATDELHEQRMITDATWASLAAELTDRQLIELCMLVGHYEMLAMTLNSLGVEAEPSALASLDASAASIAEQLRAALGRSRR